MFPVFLLLFQPISWSLTTNVTNGVVLVCCSYQTLPCIFFLFVYTYFFYQIESSWRQELLSYSILQNYTMETCIVRSSVSKINLKGKNLIQSNHPWKALRKGQFWPFFIKFNIRCPLVLEQSGVSLHPLFLWSFTFYCF